MDAGSAAAEDFGHIVHRVPRTVVRPRSASEVTDAIRRAAGWGVGFAAQGRRHSAYGRAQAEDGVVADMSELSAVGPVDDDRIVVEAGASWRQVLAATLAQGMTPPVLCDYLDLSVGGTLVVGGIGASTSRYGVQSDNVIELEVVTGTGQIVRCSAHDGAELFDAARAGLGQVGVITRATLRLVAAPRAVRALQLHYPDLAAMLAESRRLAGDRRFDTIQGAVLPQPGGGWTFRLDAVRHLAADGPDDCELLADLSDDPAQRRCATVPYIDHLDRLAALEGVLRDQGRWSHPHPWLATFVGDSAAQAVVARELEELDPAADLGPFGQVVLSPIRTAAVTSPLMRLPAEDLCHAFNLIRLPAPPEAARLVAANRAAYLRVRDAGGTLHPVSAFELTPQEWRRHFGPAYAGLAAAKHRYDPGGLLTPGYGVFPGGP